MSAYCTVDAAMKNLQSFDSKLTIDTFLVKAASKAFQKVFKQSNVDISKFVNGTIHHY
jgi:hypothetical protein